MYDIALPHQVIGLVIAIPFGNLTLQTRIVFFKHILLETVFLAVFGRKIF